MKKLFAILLAAAMLLGLLAGCGSTAESTASAASVAEEPQSAAEEPAAEEVPEEPEEPEALEDSALEDSAVEEPEEPGWVYEPLSYPLTEESVTLDYWLIWELSPDTKYSDVSEHICLKELADATGIQLNLLA